MGGDKTLGSCEKIRSRRPGGKKGILFACGSLLLLLLLLLLLMMMVVTIGGARCAIV